MLQNLRDTGIEDFNLLIRWAAHYIYFMKLVTSISFTEMKVADLSLKCRGIIRTLWGFTAQCVGNILHQ